MSTNISKEKRDGLVQKIKDIRSFVATAKQDENTGNLLSYLNELEKEIQGKKYGLIFEEHRENIDDILDSHEPVLTEDKSLFVNKGGQMNFLIEGDNLASLKLLQKTHKDKIDVIYIDPPYNTLKEGFTYSDSLVDGNDTFRHSKWLSFMEQRMELAHKLLSPTGVVFISIDENEFAQLKLLCDTIFGEKNFIDCIIWNKRVPKNDKGIGNIHEYILLYSKNSDYKYKFLMAKEGLDDIFSLLADCKKKKMSIQETEEKLRQLYKKKSYDRAITLYNSVDENYRIWGKINMSWPNGNTFGPRYDVLHPTTHKPVKVPDRGWRWNEDTFNRTVDYIHAKKRFDGSYLCGGIWFSKDENMQPSSVKYLDEVDRMLLRSIISLKSDGGIELEKYFGEKSIFAYPKPVLLIKMLLDAITYNNKNCTILDFFAGSATTAQAVLSLNADDNGKRTFILATNNQNGICRGVAYERIKRVVEREEYNASLKYFKVDYIPITDRMYYEYADELLRHIRELVELENGVDFAHNSKVSIALTDEELFDFLKNTELLKKCSKVYVGHDVLVSAEQETLLKQHRIMVNVIPDYYYREQEG